MDKSKFIILTGAAGSIGQAIAKKLSNDGWHIIGIDKEEISDKNLKEQYFYLKIKLDLREIINEKKRLDNLILKINQSTDNKLYGIINNAAIQKTESFENLSINDWKETIEVNLLTPIILINSFLDQLRNSKGTVVNIGSIHSQLSKSLFSSYSTTKAGLAGLTRALSIELGSHIRVNSVEPAAIETNMLREGFKNQDDSFQKLYELHPTKNIGSPEDVANAVKFLINPKNTFLNGCLLSLSGGIQNCLLDPYIK